MIGAKIEDIHMIAMIKIIKQTDKEGVMTNIKIIIKVDHDLTKDKITRQIETEVGH